MANSSYSVDDILEEIRKKKQRDNAPEFLDYSQSAIKRSTPEHAAEDFFEMREKGERTAEQESEEKVPTFTREHLSEPTTTRTIQVDDTLSQYFGPSEWKNGKKPKDQKEGFASKVNVVPAHEKKQESNTAETVKKTELLTEDRKNLSPGITEVHKNEEKEYIPKDMTLHFEKQKEAEEKRIRDEKSFTSVKGGFAGAFSSIPVDEYRAIQEKKKYSGLNPNAETIRQSPVREPGKTETAPVNADNSAPSGNKKGAGTENPVSDMKYAIPVYEVTNNRISGEKNKEAADRNQEFIPTRSGENTPRADAQNAPPAVPEIPSPEKPVTEETVTKIPINADENQAEGARAHSDLTSSANRDLYREYTEKRRDKVEEFMKQVVEPTNQQIHVPLNPEEEGIKNRYSDKDNKDIAKELIDDMHSPEADYDPDDYDDISQKEIIWNNIKNDYVGALIKTCILGVLSAVSLALCLAPALGLELPEIISLTKENKVFPVVNLAIVLVAALVAYRSVGNGLIGMLRLKACNDSFAALSVIGSGIIGVLYSVYPDKIEQSGANLYFPVTVMCLFFITVGKVLMTARVKNNFMLLKKDGIKSAILPVHNKDLARELTGQTDELPRFCTSAKADFFTRFLNLSYRDDSTEGVARSVVPIIFISGIIIGAVAFLLTGSVESSLIGISAVYTVASPFAAAIAGNLNVYRSCKALNTQGSILAGGYTAETFSETDSVLLDIEDVFPAGSITLHGIKTFAHGRIDEAILDAASVICNTKNTLESIFLNVVQGDRRLLKPVDTIIYEDGMGLSAWVDGKRVLIGNRELMVNHNIDIPSHDYESKYVGSGKDILYLANSGELTAMFVISYHADENVYKSLGIMAQRGMKLVINCSDPNITSEKLSALFDYPKNSIKVLSSKYQQKCAELTKKRDRAPAAAVYDGSLGCLSDIINCCGKIRQSLFLASLLEILGIVVGFVITVIYLFTGNIADLKMYILLLLQIFWLIAVTVVSLLRKKI